MILGLCDRFHGITPDVARAMDASVLRLLAIEAMAAPDEPGAAPDEPGGA